MGEKHKKYQHRCWRIGGLITLIIVIILGVRSELSFGVPGITHGLKSQPAASKPIEITVYLTTATLAEIFQNRVNQILDGTVATDPINNLPLQLRQMADALLQPSVALHAILPLQNSITTDLQLSFFPDDPHPISTHIQINFHVLSSSMLQVNVKPLPGNPALVSGPIASIQIPLGQLDSVETTPSCGVTALALHLHFSSVPPSPPPTASGLPPTTATVIPSDGKQTRSQSPPQPHMSTLHVMVDIPPSSLDEIGQDAGSIPISATISASNIHILVQHGMLNITSNLSMGSLTIGSTQTTVLPTAKNGYLTIHVLNTSVQLFHTLPFSNNTYNQQLEMAVNARLRTTFANTLAIEQITVGSNVQVQVPCAPTNGMLLIGSTHLA